MNSVTEHTSAEHTSAEHTMTGREAMRSAMCDAMRSDDRVVLIGEDVGRYGGCFAVSAGMLEEFGQERVRDTPLSESAFVGAGIGAAIGGLRPIVEVMTVNFGLLALDQIVNNAATLRHMSGGQVGVPLVIRMTTGGGRQLAAQHSHSFDGWFAHVPGLKIVAPGTIEDFRWMLAPALADPDPVIIFEHGALYRTSGPVGSGDPGRPLHLAAVRRRGRHVSLIGFGRTLGLCLDAAEVLDGRGIDAEVVDLRSLRPLDDATIVNSVVRTGRAVVVDEGWRSVGISAEIAARITEEAFGDLHGPVARVCAAETPMPYAAHLEQAALPSVERIVAAATTLVDGTRRRHSSTAGAPT
jgi:pyruvate dehydrogenase E1 component beta subunit